MTELVAKLRGALAETWAFYFLAHSFHWNVRGPLFRQMHEFFGAIYEDAHGAVDDLAERLRTLGVPAPGSLQEIAAGASIAFPGAASVAEMVLQLGAANQAVIKALSAANSAAAAAGNDGLTNLLQARLDQHAKWDWQLSETANASAAAG